jgi:hypothetical protein
VPWNWGSCSNPAQVVHEWKQINNLEHDRENPDFSGFQRGRIPICSEKQSTCLICVIPAGFGGSPIMLCDRECAVNGRTESQKQDINYELSPSHLQHSLQRNQANKMAKRQNGKKAKQYQQTKAIKLSCSSSSCPSASLTRSFSPCSPLENRVV